MLLIWSGSPTMWPVDSYSVVLQQRDLNTGNWLSEFMHMILVHQ